MVELIASGLAINFAYDLLKVGFFSLRKRKIGKAGQCAMQEVFRDSTAAFLLASHRGLRNKGELRVQEDLLSLLAKDPEARRLLLELALSPNPSTTALRDRCSALGLRADWFPGGFEAMLSVWVEALGSELVAKASEPNSPILALVTVSHGQRLLAEARSLRVAMTSLDEGMTAQLAEVREQLQGLKSHVAGGVTKLEIQVAGIRADVVTGFAGMYRECSAPDFLDTVTVVIMRPPPGVAQGERGRRRGAGSRAVR